MHEEYFHFEHVSKINAGFWFMLKLRLFGKRIVERAGQIEAVWYAYRGKLYMVKYAAYWLK